MPLLPVPWHFGNLLEFSGSDLYEIFFGRKTGVTAADKPHLQMIDGKIRVVELFEEFLGKTSLTGM